MFFKHYFQLQLRNSAISHQKSEKIIEYNPIHTSSLKSLLYSETPSYRQAVRLIKWVAGLLKIDN